MRAFPSLLDSPPYPLSSQTASTSTSTKPYQFPFPAKLIDNSSQFHVSARPKILLSQFRPNPLCCITDPTVLDANRDNFDDDGDGYSEFFLLDEKTEETLSGDGIFIQIKKLGRNSRRIRSKIAVDASLDTIWSILTDYEKLADFIPGLAVSKLIKKEGNCARLYQIGQQNLPFGLKFNAKGILDCYEKELENLPFGKKRDIEFKMMEGDFQLFEGKWSIEQFSKEKCEDSESSRCQECQTTLSYLVDIKPKLWLPVRVVEGRLCSEIKKNLSSIREEAKKVIHEALHDL